MTCIVGKCEKLETLVLGYINIDLRDFVFRLSPSIYPENYVKKSDEDVLTEEDLKKEREYITFLQSQKSKSFLKRFIFDSSDHELLELSNLNEVIDKRHPNTKVQIGHVKLNSRTNYVPELKSNVFKYKIRENDPKKSELDIYKPPKTFNKYQT